MLHDAVGMAILRCYEFYPQLVCGSWYDCILLSAIFATIIPNDECLWNGLKPPGGFSVSQHILTYFNIVSKGLSNIRVVTLHQT